MFTYVTVDNGNNVEPGIHSLSFASQNVRSFNISTKNDITWQKILTVTKQKADMIMLCDLHLNSHKQKSSVHDIEKRFMLEGYKFIHNSEGPSRGVGILLHKNLRDESFNINNVRRDKEGNYILLDLNIKNNRYTVGSVYGPNYDEQVNMYHNIVSSCPELKNEKVILGGDFNATWDTSRVNANIDVVNMVNIPNRIRSEKIRLIAEQLKLIEPYRLLHPEKKNILLSLRQ